MSTSHKAIIALFGTILLWAYMAVVAKTVVQVISPITVLFFRLMIAALCFLPFFIRNQSWKKQKFKNLLFVSLGSTVNVSLFTIGLKYTSASVSQLIYAAMPILILIYTKLFLDDIHSKRKIAGVLIGFLGLILIGYMSAIEKGETITGTLLGNLLIFAAMLGWTFYLISSKKLSRYFSPIEMGSTSIIVSFVVSFFLILIHRDIFNNIFLLNANLIISLLYIGVGGTFITYILYQFAVRHTSTLNVSLSSYVQPVITTVLAIIILGERLTLHFLLGSALILSGVFLTSSVKFKFR